MTRRLHVVHGYYEPIVGRVRTPGLASRPFRPGELPRRLVVDLDGDAETRAVECATQDGVPLGLWVRVAVEAARHLGAASSPGGAADRAALAAAVDAMVARPAAAESVVVEARELTAYARELTRGGGEPVSADGEALSIDVSDEVALSWHQAAMAGSCSVNEWVSRMIMTAPAGAVAWEAAAARSGMTLGELVYAEALRLATASSC
jgi:hypothetical protein